MKKPAVLILFILSYTAVYAQNTGAYLVPRQIYIGDPAVLILPLPGAAQDSDDIVLTRFSPGFPSHSNMDINRIILERRVNGSRLMIEFTPFNTGLLELPVIEIGGDRFYGLTVTVNSILDSRSSPILSGPASSLAMPGTAFMLYGSMTAIAVFFLLTIWFIIKGRILIKKIREKWKRWRLFFTIKVTEKRLYRSVLKGEDKRLILDKISGEFRIFLTCLTESNCRAMTAGEFKNSSFDVLLSQNLNVSFLHDFFRRCDELRFSGSDVNSKEILRLLANLRSILAALEKTKRKIMQKEIPAA